MDLQGVSFAQAIMNSTTLIGANLADADLALTRLLETDLRRARMPSASLDGSVLLGTELTDADLSDASALGALFGEGTTMVRTRLEGAALQGAVFVGVSNYMGASFDAARLAGASLAGEDLGCQTWDADASLCDPPMDTAERARSCVSFQGAQMQGANLLQSNLGGADFTGAALESANLFEAELICARLTNTNFRAADLTRAVVSGAVFQATILEFADLSGVDFSGLTFWAVSLKGADLAGALFRSVTFQDVDLRGTDMLPADWAGARFGGTSICSNGLPVLDRRNGAILDLAHPENFRVGTCDHPVHPGNLLIETQADAEAMRNLSGVTGGLTVTGTDDLRLDFYGLVSIGGNLTVHAQGLTRFGAMPSLLQVQGDVLFQGNEHLVAVETLGDPAGGLRISGSLNFSGNPQLTDLRGLRNLVSVGGGFVIEHNDLLASLDGLQGLTLAAFRGDNLDFWIVANAALASLDGLNNLTDIGGNLVIRDNPTLTNLEGLQGVRSIGGALELTGSPALQSVDGLRSLQSAGGLAILNNLLLQDLNGLSALETVVGIVLVTDNRTLQDVSGLGNVGSVGGNLVFQRNRALTGCRPWMLLATIGQQNVGGRFIFGDNAPDCEPLPFCCAANAQEPPPVCAWAGVQTIRELGSEFVSDSRLLPSRYRGSCGGAGPEQVFALPSLGARFRVTIEIVDATHDTVLYVRRACDDSAPAAELGCNDDLGPGNMRSRLELDLDPALYYIFVDSQIGAGGQAWPRVTFEPL